LHLAPPIRRICARFPPHARGKIDKFRSIEVSGPIAHAPCSVLVPLTSQIGLSGVGRMA
jgi:hypothetical protein